MEKTVYRLHNVLKTGVKRPNRKFPLVGVATLDLTNVMKMQRCRYLLRSSGRPRCDRHKALSELTLDAESRARPVKHGTSGSLSVCFDICTVARASGCTPGVSRRHQTPSPLGPADPPLNLLQCAQCLKIWGKGQIIP